MLKPKQYRRWKIKKNDLRRAINYGSTSGNTDKDLTYYIMAKEFGFSPKEVDEMDYCRVEAMIYINSLIKKKEQEEMKNANRRRA